MDYYSSRRTLSLHILPFVSVTWAIFVNRTIDDEFGDGVTGARVAYYPPGTLQWKQGNACSGCLIHLDTSRVHGGTWHDTSQHPNNPEIHTITAHFNGTAVYVYNVLSAYLYGPELKNLTVTYLTFEIDGRAVGEFFHNGHSGVQYGVPVLAHVGLEDGPHTLVIRVPPGPTGQDWSFVLFDYIQYTTSENAPPFIPPSPINISSNPSISLPSFPAVSSPPASSPHAQIPVGAIVGIVLGLITTVAVVYVLTRQRVLSARRYLEETSTPLPMRTPRPSEDPATLRSAAEAAHSTPPVPVSNRALARPASLPTIEARDAHTAPGVLHAEVAALRRQVARMRRELLDAPPDYASNPPSTERPRSLS